MGHVLRANLLGRHVSGRADPGELGRVLVAPLLERGSEVAYLGVARLREEDVAGLDVAVYHPVLEGVLERADALEDDLDHLVEGQQVGDIRVRLERRARHEFHHQVAVLGLGHGVEDLDDVRMAELAGERRLGEERLVHHALGLRIDVLVEQEHLDGDFPVGEGIAREVDAAGRSAADLANDRIFPQVLQELELHRHVVRAFRCERGKFSSARCFAPADRRPPGAAGAGESVSGSAGEESTAALDALQAAFQVREVR